MKPAFFVFDSAETFSEEENQTVVYEGIARLDEIVAIVPSVDSLGYVLRRNCEIILRNGARLHASGEPSNIIRRWIDEVMKHSAPKPGWNHEPSQRQLDDV